MNTIMSKIRQGNKEQKKQPLLTPKEMRSAKQAEKRATDIGPLVTHGTAARVTGQSCGSTARQTQAVEPQRDAVQHDDKVIRVTYQIGG